MKGIDFIGCETLVQKFKIEDISEVNNDLTAENITFVPQVLSYNDYFPFGMLVPQRNYSSPEYRYGFNSMEKDDEVKGNNNSYTTSFRSYDPRIGRWLTNDPLFKQIPWQSPYLGMDNKPIIRNDVNGDCPTCVSGFIISGLLDITFQVGEHMFEGEDVNSAFKKVNWWQVTGEATLGGVTGAFDGGTSKFAAALASSKKRKVLTKVIEFGLGYLLEEAVRAGWNVSGVESTIYGLLGKKEKKYWEIGKIGEQKTVSVLESAYEKEIKSGKYNIATHVYAKNLEGGKNTYIDAVVYNVDTGDVIEIAETKSSFHTTKKANPLSSGQKDMFEKGKKFQFGNGKSVPKVLQNTHVSKDLVERASIFRYKIHKYTGKVTEVSTKLLKRIIKKIK